MANKKPAAKSAAKPAAKAAAKSRAKSASAASSGAGSRSRKTADKAVAKEKQELSPSWSILLFGVGLILVFMSIIPGQSAWKWLHDVLFGLLGACTYALGPIMIHWAVQVALKRSTAYKGIKIGLLLSFISGTLVVFSKFDLTGLNPLEVIVALYQNGQQALLGGGVLGGVFGASMLALCGRPAANIILLVLLAAGSMLVASLTPVDLWNITGAWMQRRQTAHRERVRKREEQLQLEPHAEEHPSGLGKRLAEAAQRQLPGGRGSRAVDIDLGPAPVAESDTSSEPLTREDAVGPGGTFGMLGAGTQMPKAPAIHLFDNDEQNLAEDPYSSMPPAQENTQPGSREGGFSTPISVGQARQQAEVATEPELENLIRKAMQNPEQPLGQPVLAMDKNDQLVLGTEEELTPIYQFPPLELFEKNDIGDDPGAQEELKHNADLLVKTLDSFGVRTKVLDICRGPTVTRYELQPQAGVKISKITSLSDDIALNLATAGVRIEAPIPGKPAVGIEVPNRVKSPVGIRGILESAAYKNNKSPLPLALGRDIAGAVQVADLCKMPHLLIAGSTGSGKSVCVNSIIMGFLYNASPDDIKLILIDPKVVELAEYNGIPHLLMPVVTEPRKAAGALGSAVAEMERRYHLFAENNVRDIKSFNKLVEGDDTVEKLPYIAIIIDELADLMMVAGKEVEDYICRIAQKARAAGMHLIVATQRPSVDVITGLIKANIPSRIAFAVSSQVDSRTILDGAGAEKLLGMGDMLFLPVGAPKPVRIQGTFVKDEEISDVLDFIKRGSTAQYNEAMIAEMEKRSLPEKAADGSSEGGESHDPMLKQAAETVIEAGLASTSLLQRRCKLGYARAARIMDEMEQMGIIGPYQGAKPREVLINRQQWIEMNMNEVSGSGMEG